MSAANATATTSSAGTGAGIGGATLGPTTIALLLVRLLAPVLLRQMARECRGRRSRRHYQYQLQRTQVRAPAHRRWRCTTASTTIPAWMPPPGRGECAATATPIRPGSSSAGPAPAPPALPWTATRGGFGAWRIRPASATLLRRQIKGRSAAHVGRRTYNSEGTLALYPGERQTARRSPRRIRFVGTRPPWQNRGRTG